MPKKLSAQFVCPSPNFLEKKLSLGVRSPCQRPKRPDILSKDLPKNMCKSSKNKNIIINIRQILHQTLWIQSLEHQFYQKYSSMGLIYKHWILKYASNNLFLTFSFNHCFMLLLLRTYHITTYSRYVFCHMLYVTKWFNLY